jgi:hypothetical protein
MTLGLLQRLRPKGGLVKEKVSTWPSDENNARNVDHEDWSVDHEQVQPLLASKGCHRTGTTRWEHEPLSSSCKHENPGPTFNKTLGRALLKMGRGARSMRVAVGKIGLEQVPPNFLLVVSPNLLNDCAGCYILQPNAHANGQPLWKHVGKAYWLFSTPMGRWAIAGKDVKEKGFVRGSGWIYQERYHKGLMPDQSGSRWQLFDGKGAFTSDEAFKVTAQIGDQERDFILQAPDSFGDVLPKSQVIAL